LIKQNIRGSIWDPPRQARGGDVGERRIVDYGGGKLVSLSGWGELQVLGHETRGKKSEEDAKREN